MKQGWEIKSLRDVCDILNGGTPDTTIPKFWDGENLWITPKDMGKMESIYVDDTLRKITDEGLKNSSAKILPINSIILSSRAPIGHLAINTKPITTNQGCKGLVPKDGISTLYIYYFLSNSVDLLNNLGAGATFKELSGSKLGSVEIPLPPLPEQQRIVSILEEAFAAIAKAKANAEQNLKNAKELFESYLQGVFENKGEEWEEKRLGDVCEISSRLIDPRKAEFQNLIHVGAGNIESQKGTLIELKTAKEENLISGKFLFDESMVLYSKIRPYLMKVVKCEFKGLCSADIYPLVPLKNELTRDFLYYLLLTQNFTDYAILGSQRAGMPKVNREHLFSYNLCVPPLKTQQSIVQKLDALSAETKKLEAIYQKKLHDLEGLKKSVLQKAFSGELSVDINASIVAEFPVTIPTISTTDLHAGIIALAFKRHQEKGMTSTFGHVKAEKIVHMAESYLGIQLNRQPIKAAAGPNDFPLAKKVESRAAKAGFFTVEKRGDSYTYLSGNHIDKLIEKVEASLNNKVNDLIGLLDLILPMTTQQAEILATVFAAWNNLLIDNQAISDEAIVFEARENWHPDKLKIPREKFFNAIGWMKNNSIIPTGRGRKVTSKPS